MPFVEEHSFAFDFDVEVFHKSGGAHPRRIAGFVSTENMDQQGETLIQAGLDFSHFLSKGWFNDNHGRDTTDIVGWPESAELIEKGGKRGWWVEGHLLETEKATRLWELANALQKSDRRLGFSVEGKILERQGSAGEIVAKALVKNVAITNSAVNDATRMDVLAKSLSAMNKALSVGAPFAPGGPGAPAGGAAVPGSGGAIMPQSLAGTGRKKRKKRADLDLNPLAAQGGLTKSEGVRCLLARRPDLSIAAATAIYDYAAETLS